MCTHSVNKTRLHTTIVHRQQQAIQSKVNCWSSWQTTSLRRRPIIAQKIKAYVTASYPLKANFPLKPCHWVSKTRALRKKSLEQSTMYAVLLKLPELCRMHFEPRKGDHEKGIENLQNRQLKGVTDSLKMYIKCIFDFWQVEYFGIEINYNWIGF